MMIISASRRTDIPAYFTPWLLRRLEEGYCMARGPYHAHRVSRIALDPCSADCLILWTKNPLPLLGELSRLETFGIPFCFQYTLTPYGEAAEPGMPSLEARVQAFHTLARRYGPDRVLWRYDPVILGGGFSVDAHIARFAQLCAALEGAARYCIFSFVDLYRKNKAGLAASGLRPVLPEEMHALARGFAEPARRHGFTLGTCCEAAELHEYGVEHAACVDQARMEALLGCPVAARKDPGQRTGCRCVESIDIGIYDTCPGGCVYCYATSSRAAAARGFAAHDPASPLLTGALGADDVIATRAMPSVRQSQQSLY